MPPEQRGEAEKFAISQALKALMELERVGFESPHMTAFKADLETAQRSGLKTPSADATPKNYQTKTEAAETHGPGASESHVTSAYGQARAWRDGTQQEKRNRFVAELGVAGDSVKWIADADWVAIRAADKRKTLHGDQPVDDYYVIPNPLTALGANVGRLKRFYREADVEDLRSKYTVTKPTWISEAALERIKFDINQVNESIVNVLGFEGKMTKVG